MVSVSSLDFSAKITFFHIDVTSCHLENSRKVRNVPCHRDLRLLWSASESPPLTVWSVDNFKQIQSKVNRQAQRKLVHRHRLPRPDKHTIMAKFTLSACWWEKTTLKSSEKEEEKNDWGKENLVSKVSFSLFWIAMMCWCARVSYCVCEGAIFQGKNST